MHIFLTFPIILCIYTFLGGKICTYNIKYWKSKAWLLYNFTKPKID